MFRKVCTFGRHYSVCYNYKERESCFTTEVLAIHIYTIARNMYGWLRMCGLIDKHYTFRHETRLQYSSGIDDAIT